MRTVTGEKALEKLTEMLEQGRKGLICGKCNQKDMTLITNYAKQQEKDNTTLADFSTVCNKCNDITNYELVKTYGKY